MKLKNLRYIQMLSVIMTLLMLASFVPAMAVNDGVPQDSQASSGSLGQGEQSQEATEQETRSYSIEFEADEEVDGSELGIPSEESNESRALVTLSDGVYMIENLYNSGYYMSVRGAQIDYGARLVQRHYSGSTPISIFDRQSLFKISKITGTSRYVIRSMLNNRVGIGIELGEVVTKILPYDDADVNVSDTFTITYSHTAGGYEIKQYGTSNTLAVNRTSNSGDDEVPGSYIIYGSASDVGERGRWVMTQYTGEIKYGYYITETSNVQDGIIKGDTGTIWIKSWSTIVGANRARIQVTVGEDDIITSEWYDTNSRLVITALKCGRYQLHRSIMKGAQYTYVHTYYSRSVIPDIVDEISLVRNRATKKFIEVVNGSTDVEGIIQQWDLHSGTHARWIFELDGYGFFRIKSLKSNLYIGVDPTDTDKVRQYSTISDYSRWILSETDLGYYNIECVALSSNDEVLSVPSTNSNNGADLTMLEYTDNAYYMDEWEIYCITYLDYWNSDSDFVLYWNHTPTIYVRNDTYSPQFYFESGVAYAKSQWSDVLNMNFESSDSESTADIKIYGMTPEDYTKSTNKAYDNNWAGITSPISYDTGYADYQGEIKGVKTLQSAKVYIIYKSEAPKTSDVTKNIVVHEMGHALGYAGHSTVSTDVMYSVAHSNYVLSENEKNHLIQIYNALD